jgi:hypothetical protein
VPLKQRCSPIGWLTRPYSTCSATAESAPRSRCIGLTAAGAFGESMHSKVVRKENDPVLSRPSLIGRGRNLPARDNDPVRLNKKESSRGPLPQCPGEREFAGVVVVLANYASRFVNLELEPALQVPPPHLAVTWKSLVRPGFDATTKGKRGEAGSDAQRWTASRRAKAVAATHQYDLDQHFDGGQG